ncbi:MAG TPA: DUF5134 domain-containing protein [Streptosporangiaceae bacterium]|nr:DUF5134 domain-containing protein [Streptosporangiaceae bacterium]
MNVAGRRRELQLCLAVLWLLDGVLQAQAFMFSSGFGRSVGPAAAGSPPAVAGPVQWASGLISAHPALATTAIAVVQVTLGLGVAWRPTVKPALAASVPWAVMVWWLGEGFGGLFTGQANPVTGAPGAVILYAVLAVILWPADRDESAPSAAASSLGRRAACSLWLFIWGGLGCLCLVLGLRAPASLRESLVAMTQGQPGWLASVNTSAGRALGHLGPQVSLAMAAALGVIAAGPLLPVPWRRRVLVLAGTVAAVWWVAGQDFGGVLTGMATDVNSGPLLALLTAAYWPVARTVPARALLPGARLDGAHTRAISTVMALAMGLTLLGWQDRLLETAWAAVFGVSAAWSSCRAAALRQGRSRWSANSRPQCHQQPGQPVAGQHLSHAVCCGAMLFMMLVPLSAPVIGAGGTAMTGGSGAGAAGAGMAFGAALLSVLTVLFTAAMASTVVLMTDRLATAASVQRLDLGGWCQILIALAMTVMLVRML